MHYYKAMRQTRMIFVFHVLLPLLLLLSLQNAVSFAPSRQHQRLSEYASFRRRSHQWHYVTCLYVKDDDDQQDDAADYNDDDDEEESDVEYEKFEKESKMHRQEEEEGGTLPPLPEFLNQGDDDDDGSSTSPSPPSMDETQRRIEQQQQQIDTLMELVQTQQQKQQPPQEQQSHQFNQLSETPPSTSLPPMETDQESYTNSIAPLKAMLFIDGTWLYYSIHERNEQKCPIVKIYGRGWQTRYRFDWAALIRVISEQLQQQHPWNSSQNVEITRASVYTSCKKDTSKHSNRIKMFDEMRTNNYDVFMMETVGPGEKCVDIQLAVEMLHYATVQNAYDVAILLSGDKDFLPALIRTRQKGRKVAIVAMRNGCNRALYETPNVKDYDVVWIDDFLDRLVVPREGAQDVDPNAVSIFTLYKVIYDFIQQSGLPRVSSRDIGRYLKQTMVANRSLLDELKHSYGGLYQFLTVSGCFDVVKQRPREELLARRADPTDRTFWAALHNDAEHILVEEAKRAHFTPFEKEFFDNYSLSELIDDNAYSQMLGDGGDREDEPMVIPEELKRDFSKCKVAELKEECRERGLPVSGTKAVLLERIQADVEQHIAELQRQYRAKTRMKRPEISGRINGEGRGRQPYSRSQPSAEVPTETEQYLEGLVKEYIQARGGRASSRDIGRYLATNADSGGRDGTSSPGQQGRMSALSELKSLYGGLNAFIMNRQESFEKSEIIGDDDSFDTRSYEFQVAIRK